MVEGEWSTFSPSFSSTKIAPRNHRQTARATPTVPNGSYEKFSSNTRPVSRMFSSLIFCDRMTGKSEPWIRKYELARRRGLGAPSNLISKILKRKHYILLCNTSVKSYLGFSGSLVRRGKTAYETSAPKRMALVGRRDTRKAPIFAAQYPSKEDNQCGLAFIFRRL